ncbi:MAG: zinc-dependent dehydrogenase [Thermodesulfobacteriota bacterium]
MRVAVYYSNQDVRVEERPVPGIGAGELLVQVMASGICGSDVMEWYRKKKAPLVLGHEIAGRVIQVGKDVTSVREGDRVFVSHHVPCNTCRYCLSGMHTVCETLHTTNFDPGGFSEYLRVPRLNVDRGVFRLPDTMSYEEGTFIEPLACVVRAHRVAGFSPGKTVLVLGAGISGLLHIALARATGAGRIIATDVNPFRLDAARKFGADLALYAEENILQRIREENEGRGADLVFVCTGALPAFTQSLQCVERGGTLVVFAPTAPGVTLPVPVNDFWRNGITITHAYGAGPADIVTAMDLIGFKRVPVTEMITHRLDLADIARGFSLVATAQDSIKVVVYPNECPDRGDRSC